MPDTKITALAAIGANPIIPSTFPIPMVDLTDTSMAASGTTKKVTVNQILQAGGTATLASATITGDLTVKTNVLKVDTTNNRVGIGTATPLNAAQIQGIGQATVTPTVTGDGSALSLIDSAGFANSGGMVAFGAGVANGNIGQVSIKSLLTNGSQNGTSDLAIFTRAATSDTTLAERFRIAQGGICTWSNVGGVAGTAMTLNSTGLGVGVASPAYKLQATGLVVASDPSFSGSTNFIGAILNNDGTTPGIDLRRFTGTPSTHGTTYIATDATGATFFYNGVQASNTKATSLKMTLSATGQLLLGTSTTNGAVDIGMVMNKPSATGFVGNVYQLNGVDKAFAYISSAAAAFRVDTATGYTINMVSATNGVYLANGGTSWTALSDERFKDIIEPISNAVAKVGSLRSVIGKFKTESEGTRRSFLIAQDVQAVLPEAVDASNPDQLGVAYTEVIPLLVAAIKELAARVQTLETR